MDERNQNQPDMNAAPNQPQYPPQPPMGYAPPPPPPPAPKDNRNLAMVGMILGIVSIVISCAWYLAIPAGIAAIILGVKGLHSSGRTMAIAAIVCGIIGIAVGFLWIILVFVLNIGAELLNAYPSYY